MSTDMHNSAHGRESPVHDDVAFEPRDIKSSSVLKFLFFLGFTLVAAVLICLAILRSAQSRIARLDTPPPPVRQGAAAIQPPEPRLQAQGLPREYKDIDPQQDFRDKVKADIEALDKTAWVDEKAGIAQIPIGEAMKIVAEKGLPAASRQAAAAPKAAAKQ